MKNKTFKSVTHKGDVYQIPFLITCTVSGLVKTYTSEDYINGKLDRFGGLAKLTTTYVCRDALKLRKKGMSDADIRAKLNPAPVQAGTEPVAPAAPETPAPQGDTAPAADATTTSEPPASEEVPAPEEQVNITPEDQGNSDLEAQAEEHLNAKPIAKKDKRGWFRDAKGHVVAKDRLGEYDLREADGVTAAAA